MTVRASTVDSRAVLAAQHDGAHPSGVVALEADRRPVDGHDRLGQGHARRAQALGGPRGQDPGQVVAGTDRLDLGGPGRDDDLAGLDVEHPGRRPRHDGRPGIDADDLVAVARVEDQRVGASARGQAAAPAPPPMTTVSTTRRSTGTSGRAAPSGSGGFPPAGCRATTAPGRAAVWQVRT